jgi:hypothetical protein
VVAEGAPLVRHDLPRKPGAVLQYFHEQRAEGVMKLGLLARLRLNVVLQGTGPRRVQVFRRHRSGGSHRLHSHFRVRYDAAGPAGVVVESTERVSGGGENLQVPAPDQRRRQCLYLVGDVGAHFLRPSRVGHYGVVADFPGAAVTLSVVGEPADLDLGIDVPGERRKVAPEACVDPGVVLCAGQ